MFLTMTLTAEMSDGGWPWSEAWAGTPGPSPAVAVVASLDSPPTLGSGFAEPPGPSFSSGPEWMASFASMSGMSKAARRSSKSGVFMSPMATGPRPAVPLPVRAETRRSLPYSGHCRRRRPPRDRRYFLLLSRSASPSLSSLRVPGLGCPLSHSPLVNTLVVQYCAPPSSTLGWP